MLHLIFKTYKISVKVSIPTSLGFAGLNTLTTLIGLPLEIWETKICTYNSESIALGEFLQELNNGNYEDLSKQLKNQYRIDIDSFKSEVSKQIIATGSFLGYMCFLPVNITYKTKKESKIRKALGTNEIVWVIITVGSSIFI